jgi:carbon-monoxide dehydrogenase medium subunit
VIRIGAMTTHTQVADSPLVRGTIPALASLAAGIGDRQVRNRGTIGGSVANNDPAACYPAAMLALGATIETDRRRIAADDFFRGLFSTALEPDEVLVALHVPVPRRAAYVKFEQPASRFALVGVAVADTATGVRVAVTGAGPGVYRAEALEARLQSRFEPAALAGARIDPAGLNGDLHAGADYRAHLVVVLAQRALARALATFDAGRASAGPSTDIDPRGIR